MTRLFLSLVMLLIVGCGDGGYSGPHGQVSGKATFDGKPIPEGSQILFQATAASYVATGSVNSEGGYTLQYEGGPNLPSVTYQVQINPPSKASSSVVDPVEAAKVTISTEAPPFPAKYSVPSKDFTFTVKEGPNTADFALKK